jgi:hypothetical protein
MFKISFQENLELFGRKLRFISFCFCPIKKKKKKQPKPKSKMKMIRVHIFSVIFLASTLNSDVNWKILSICTPVLRY